MAINAYYNGEFKNSADIFIPLTDRAIFFGDGVYDAAIGRNGKIFLFDEHIERFYKNLNFLNIPFSFSKSDLKELIFKLISLSGEKSYFVYFQLTRYSKRRVHAYPKEKLSNLLITVSPFELAEKNTMLKLVICEDKRYSYCNIKTLNLLPAILASHYADIMGADEAVFSKNGIITECAHSNIHIIKHNKLITHPLDSCILPGISRKHLLSVCNKHQVKYEERKFTVEELLDADEVLVTSSSKLAIPVTEIDGRIYKQNENSTAHILSEEMRNEYLMQTE